MSDYEYTGPRIPRTPENEASVRGRFQRKVEAIADARYDEAVKAWAHTNEGKFPDRDRIAGDVAAGLETLCRALDGWADVDPDDVLAPEWRPELGRFFD